MIVRRALIAFAIGSLFGIGLAVSQMANPEKVLAFLNVAGRWDPSLLLVMLGAITVAFIGIRWATSNAPLFDERHYIPSASSIDLRLVTGAVIFGAGWGLAGYCPGPAVAGLASGSLEPVIFVVSMIVGSQASRIVTR